MKHPRGHSNMTQKEQAIRTYASEQGFELCHFASAAKLTDEAVRLDEWLNSGKHATMHWMERNLERRLDPREIVPDAQSVIVLGFNYYTPYDHEESPESGKISRYAWGDDYHDVLKPKLLDLAKTLESEFSEHVFRFYNDTGPVMEKQWARRSQLGWQGKHSNIITRTHGSWIFLSAIITTLELAPETPHADFCGSCTACIEACPTQAIVEPYVVDSTKCLSYWTIEAKPDVQIPDNIAKDMDGWMFGCDVCQDVCPWNRFSKESGRTEFAPRELRTSLETSVVSNMTQEEFSARFRKSPIKRTKLAGLKRNAAELHKNVQRDCSSESSQNTQT